MASKTKTLLNTTGSNGCSIELTETWTAITTAFTSTFTTISTTGSNAASINAFLSSGPGKSFKKDMLASASLTNSIENFIVPAADILQAEHINHARQNPRYVECSQPFTRVDTSTLASQIGNDYITVSWTLIPSCVNEKIEKIVLTGADPEATHGLTSELTNAPSTSAKIKKEHILPHAKSLHHALIYPVNRKYGSLYFDQADLDFLISA